MKRCLLGLCLLLALAGCKDETTTGTVAPKGSPATKNMAGVILLRYTPGSESTTQREEGFLEELKHYPDIHVISSDQYSGTTPEQSLDKANQILQKFAGLTLGVFAVCEPNANGTLEALQQAGLAGQVKLIGFDPNERMVKSMRDGHMQGMVLQDPVSMGEMAVKVMVAHLNGDVVEKRIPTGEYMATRENMDEPRMSQLLNPPQATGDEKPPANAKFRIAVIPKGTTHEFWKSVHFGALRAAEELGNVEILWKGPHLESDRESQISLVEDFITKKVDGIVLAPLDSQALIAPVKQAKQAGIPTVIFDSGLDNANDPELYVSYVATDNFNGGRLAAQRLAETLGAKRLGD